MFMTGTAAWYFTTSRITLGIRWRRQKPSQWFLANSSCPRVMTHSGNKLSQKKREKRSLGKTLCAKILLDQQDRDIFTLWMGRLRKVYHWETPLHQIHRCSHLCLHNIYIYIITYIYIYVYITI